MQTLFIFAFCTFDRKTKLIRTVHHKGEHISTSRALLNQDILMILLTKGQSRYIQQNFKKWILLVKLNWTSVLILFLFVFSLSCIFFRKNELGISTFTFEYVLIPEVRNSHGKHFSRLLIFCDHRLANFCSISLYPLFDEKILHKSYLPTCKCPQYLKNLAQARKIA